MANYLYLNKFNKNGNLAMNKKVFVTIGKESLKDVVGIAQKDEKLEKSKPSVVAIIRSNKISYKFNLLVEKDVSKEIIKEEVIKNLNVNLLNQCEAVPFDISGKAGTGETVCASSDGRTYLYAVCHSIHMDAVCHNGFIPDRNIFSAPFSVFGSGRGIYLFYGRFSEVCRQLRPVSVRGTDFYNAGSKEFI